MRTFVLALLIAAAPAAVLAQEANTKSDNVYQLGELQVTAHARGGEDVGGAVVTGEQLQDFDKQTIDEALDLVPGANASITGGSRNEALIYVRGFNRFEVPLSVDGVRIFLPADNRIDFSMFQTANLSEVQVSKGYASVMDGPGAMGGAINLVTIKPTRPFELTLQGTTYLDQDINQEAYLVSGRIGGRTDHFYWQLSGQDMDRDYWELSHDFNSQPQNPPGSVNPQGPGRRNNSNAKDWTANAKLGWTPNDTDEYSINYTKQEGVKNAPYSVVDNTNGRFWDWPYWNTDSLYALTRTKLSDRLTLKSRWYDNGFDNLLSSFDQAAQTTQTTPKSFNSYYRDRASGGNVELDYQINPDSQLKGVFYGRRDIHDERQVGFAKPTAGPVLPYSEPWQTDDEYTYSAAAEYSTALGKAFDLTLGGSYDWTDLQQADDLNEDVSTGVVVFKPVHYDLINHHAWNGQGALVWHLDDDTPIHFSVSDRSRFPTIFERFSSKFGTAIPNPTVGPERAVNYEIGADHRFSDTVSASGAVFYSDVQDALVGVTEVDRDHPELGVLTRTRNVGSAHFYGYEVSFDWKAQPTIDVGGNFAYTQRDFKQDVVDTQGVPTSKAFLYAAWKPVPKLTLRPSIEYASSRVTVTTYVPAGQSGPLYYRTGDYTLVGLSAEYAVTKNITATIAGQNLGDKNYTLSDGFPAAGRSFYASLRARF